ncbi:MAG: SDR family oxidoreductase [Rhizobacter sp.]|nr:SDR family oxidoreductase [Chlorobiales bacterium]
MPDKKNVIVITGATGNIGAEVIKYLRGADAEIRAAVRDAASSKSDDVNYVSFDFEHPETYLAALDGATKLFLVRPPAISDVKQFINPVVDAAKAAGITHIVFLSLLGAEKNSIVPHYKIERHIEASGVPYTFLRPSFFMQNLSTTHRDEIRSRNEIFVPAGNGKTSFIDARDIAAVAAKTLIETGHEGKSYPLTGSEALRYDEVATIFSEVLGRKITYTHPSLLRFIFHYIGKQPFAFTLVMSAIYTTARLGLAGALTDDTEKLLGRTPITMRQFAEDFKAMWL